jgi:hypothetical protein
LAGMWTFSFKVDEYSHNEAAIYGCVRLHVWIFEHALGVLHIHLYNELSDTDNMNMKHVEGVEEVIKLDLG